MDIFTLLGISHEEVRALRASHELSVYDAKRQLIHEKLTVLLEEVQDPAAKIILKVLVDSY